MADYTAKMLTDEEMVSRMVDAFLRWRMPDDFAPDAGITFTPPANGAPDYLWRPVGTNLLTAQQAKAMVRNMLDACAA